MARDQGPITVCVINLKGGVGKSTISVLLARYAFERLEKDVLAVDLDPQANLSQALMHKNYNDFLREKRPSIVEIFKGFMPPSTRNKSVGPIKSGDGVETINVIRERKLQLIPSRFDFSDNLIGSIRPDEAVLARYLSMNFMSKDFIIIDCAPTESVLTRAAYHASGFVLVPVKPEYFATIGFPLLRQSLETFQRANRAHVIDVAGVVINNAFYHGGNDGGPEKQRALHEINSEASANGWPVFQNQIPFSRGFPKLMRGDTTYSGNAYQFPYFAREFFLSIGF